MIVIREGLGEVASRRDVNVEIRQCFQRNRLREVGFLLDEGPGVSIDLGECPGRFPINRREYRPAGLGPARGEDCEKNP